MPSVECPHCRCRTPADPVMSSGQVYTHTFRVPLTGKYIEGTGAVYQSEQALVVKYPVVAYPYRIVECLQCNKKFVIESAPADRVVHPVSEPNLEPAPEIPETVRRVLLEARKAHVNGLEVCSILAARTALIRMQRQQKCQGIDDLATKGAITQFLAKQAHEIRLWGNMTAHDDVPVDHPEAEDVVQLLTFLEVLFDAIYVQPERLAKLKEKRAKLPVMTR
jgi:hypothetical protein